MALIYEWYSILYRSGWVGNKNVFRVSPKENTLKIFLNNKNNTSVVCSLFSLCDRTVLFVYKQHCVLYPTVRVQYLGETGCKAARCVPVHFACIQKRVGCLQQVCKEADPLANRTMSEPNLLTDLFGSYSINHSLWIMHHWALFVRWFSFGFGLVVRFSVYMFYYP